MITIKAYKYLVVLLILSIMKITDYSGILTDEINIYSISNGVAGSIYDSSISVSLSKIEVIDYYFKEKNMYIEPTKNEIRLPFDAIVISKNSEYIELENSKGRYKIYNAEKIKYNLYQYYYKNTILGYSDLYIISTNDYSSIVSGLIISYETI